MKILVTGANGQLGNELRELEKQFPDFNFIFTDIDELDITNEVLLNQFIQEKTPEYIINCAAYTAVDQAEEETAEAQKINALAPLYLATAAKKIGAKLIHLSTDYVFNGDANLPYKESDNVNALGIYGKTKLEGEKNCLGSNPETIIIRTSWLYSSFGSNFVKTMLRLAHKNGKVKVVYDQVGSPTYAADLAMAVLRIVSLSAKGQKKFQEGIYHYSNQGAISWYDFAKAIFEIAEVKCEVSPVLSDEFPTKVKRPSYSVLNKLKIQDIFEIEVPYWKESLKNCIDKIKNG